MSFPQFRKTKPNPGLQSQPDAPPAVQIDWVPAFPDAARRADEVVASGTVQGKA